MFRSEFEKRHIGANATDLAELLNTIGVSSVDELVEQTVPNSIRRAKPLADETGLTEFQYLKHIREVAKKNKVFKSYIGLGYHDTITPSVILRNIFENPGWYTQYTPYQAEISQGRLESLLNFQTMICDMTSMPVANASLLDEGTAAAEAMNMFFHHKNKREITSPKFFVADTVLPQTIDIIKTRAEYIGIEVEVGDWQNVELNNSYFGVLLQYPDVDGAAHNYSSFINTCKTNEIYVCVAADLLGLAILTPPGEIGADCVVGSAQRFGVPMGFGGPHAAFFATTEDFKRIIPGRIIGVSIDRRGERALRMALQTREQHIRREKATSNICTAQALLANMAAMYAVYHGAEGIKAIAQRVHNMANTLAENLEKVGYEVYKKSYFDTIHVNTGNKTDEIRNACVARHINLRYKDHSVTISLNETTELSDLRELIEIFAAVNMKRVEHHFNVNNATVSEDVARASSYLTHPVFNTHHTETQMMRYIKSLEDKDLSLNRAMISLGSCTMKLNAATEMMPLSIPEYSSIHPFVPKNQAEGYYEMISELEKKLVDITGFSAASLQPNSGAQGEFTGLLVIRAFQKDKGQGHRNIVLIPSSAHGTNPASAVMVGLQVVVVNCDENGNIDLADLRKKAELHKDNLSCLMATYPSTHGVFEETILEACEIIHGFGGQVYMDGANMNAQVGLTSPASIGADVCHLNLHKTFAIPHGGGGPGMGPICVAAHLAPYLPGHPLVKTGGEKAVHAVSAAPFGSASILLISYAYIKMLGSEGLTNATKYAILNANYIKSKLEKHYDVLYVGSNGRVAHELILDFRPFKHTLNVEVEDVAKRLMDYGFHAPTVSFPVAGTLMIEPTESEDKAEIDRFCEAMIAIRNEIAEIENNSADKTNNVLKNAPHTLQDILDSTWNFPYSIEKAIAPLPYVKANKFWPSIARVNNSYGDRNLVCTCAPIEAYAEA